MTHPLLSLPAELPDLIGHEYDKEDDAHKLFSASKVSMTCMGDFQSLRDRLRGIEANIL